MGLFRRQMQSTGLCRIDNCNNSERSSRRFIKSNEAPYQSVGRRTFSATLGYRELSSGYFWLSVLSESVSCYLYVFVVCATRISWTGSIIGHEPNLVAMALTSGAAMTLLMLTFRTVHVNPALTIAFFLTGRIPLVRALIYIMVHCVSSVAAVALLYSISVAGHAGALGLDNPHPLLESWQILAIEFVISFVVTMATYATCSYSSYTNARQFILEQVGLNCNDIFDFKSTICDTENMASLQEEAHVNHQQQFQNDASLLATGASLQQHKKHPRLTTQMASSLATAPRGATSSSAFRVHPQSKGYISDTCENYDFEYEYDNHRIYTHQQSSPELSPGGGNRVAPIEELMQDEARMLAPNGFSFLMTPCQSFIIGMAYATTSLTGIPASGASLNPARSFGPAFFMNRWDNQWIYWAGPILGAVAAGFFFEFIFNPTRPSSLCYLPKLFRLSAHDMAKVGSRSRVYQSTQKPAIPSTDAINMFPPTLSHNRPSAQAHHFPTMHNSPSARHQTATNLMSNPTLLNPCIRDSEHPQLIAPSTSLAHLQASHFTGNNFDHFNYINTQQQQDHQHQQQQQQRHQHNNQLAIDAANFDYRSKSTTIMNSIAPKHQLSTINVPGRNNFHSASSSNGSAVQDFGNNLNADGAPKTDFLPLYDNPTGCEPRFANQAACPQISGPSRVFRAAPFSAPGQCPRRPASQTLGPSCEPLLERELALKRRSAIVAAAETPSGQSVVDARAPHGGRPSQVKQQQLRRRLRAELEDENFYQTPGEEERAPSRCQPPGGSTGDASRSNSSGDSGSNQTSGAPTELVVSAERLLAATRPGENQPAANCAYFN